MASFILTFDLDFGELAALTPERPARVILFRLVNEHTVHVIERLSAVLPACQDVLSRPVIVSVEEGRYRTRYLPVAEE